MFACMCAINFKLLLKGPVAFLVNKELLRNEYERMPISGSDKLDEEHDVDPGLVFTLGSQHATETSIWTADS